MNSPTTTNEMLALVGKWRTAQFCYDFCPADCADELAPIATALCAEVEADAELANMIRKQRDTFFDEMERQRLRATAAEAQVEALRKDAERWRAYERELPDSADSTRVFLHGVAVLKAAKLAAKEPTK